MPIKCMWSATVVIHSVSVILLNHFYGLASLGIELFQKVLDMFPHSLYLSENPGSKMWHDLHIALFSVIHQSKGLASYQRAGCLHIEADFWWDDSSSTLVCTYSTLVCTSSSFVHASTALVCATTSCR